MTCRGVTAVVYTDAQAAELDRKRMNYYRKYSAVAEETVNGWTFGQWGNTQYFADLLRHALLLAIFRAKKNPKIVPWAPSGVARLRVAVRDVLDLAKAGGFIVPGQASEGATGFDALGNAE